MAFGERLGHGDRLGAAQLSELGVQLALHSAAEIEVGLPVPQHHQAARRHDRVAESADKSTATIGQSPQSRSSA